VQNFTKIGTREPLQCLLSLVDWWYYWCWCFTSSAGGVKYKRGRPIWAFRG